MSGECPSLGDAPSPSQYSSSPPPPLSIIYWLKRFWRHCNATLFYVHGSKCRLQNRIAWQQKHVPFQLNRHVAVRVLYTRFSLFMFIRIQGLYRQQHQKK